MIFSDENIARILSGTKTQTRRAVKDNHRCDSEPTPAHIITRVMTGNGWDRVLYEVGRTVALQPGRGKPAVGRAEITEIRYCDRAGDISERDATAEGYGSIGEFRYHYDRLNRYGALERPCWAISFSLVRKENVV